MYAIRSYYGVITASDALYSSHMGADGAGAKFMVSRSFPPANAFMPENPLKHDDGIPESKDHYLRNNFV